MNNDVLEFVVPATVTILLFGIFFGTMAWSRYMRYLETVKLIEHGYAPREELPGATSLRWGLVLLASGLVITVAMWPLSADEFPGAPLGISPILLGGLLPLAIGGALVLHHALYARHARPVLERLGRGPEGDVPLAPPDHRSLAEPADDLA